MADHAGDVADPLLEHDPHVLPRQQVRLADMSEQRRRSNRWMAGERQFSRRREDPEACRIGGSPRIEDEYGFGQVELGRDRLHGGIVEAFGVEHDGERIAGERRLGEDVERKEPPRHRIPTSSLASRESPLLRDAAAGNGEVVRQPVQSAHAYEGMVNIRHKLRYSRRDRIQSIAVVCAFKGAGPGSQPGLAGMDDDLMPFGDWMMARVAVNGLRVRSAGQGDGCAERRDPQQLD
jgi:hypothetical protein